VLALCEMNVSILSLQSLTGGKLSRQSSANRLSPQDKSETRPTSSPVGPAPKPAAGPGKAEAHKDLATISL
jgi:hypothetical protein